MTKNRIKICFPTCLKYCAHNRNNIVSMQVLSLEKTLSFVLSQIWKLVDSKTGYLTRSGLYKGLALVAFAQQGKQPSDKLLENSESQG